MRFELVILSVSCLVYSQNVAGQSVSCLGLDNLITNLNDGELSRCVKFGSCAGVHCINVFRQLRHIAEIFNFILLPCTQPTPALLIQLLGQQDPIHNNTRKEVYRQELINSTSIPISSGGIVLGNYNVSININISTGSIGIEIGRRMIKVLNYTVVKFDFARCPSTTTTTSNLVKTTATNTKFTSTGTPSINATGSTSGNTVGLILGVSISLALIVAIAITLVCTVLLGYVNGRRGPRIGHTVIKFLRHPMRNVVTNGEEYTNQESIVDEDDSAAQLHSISFTNPGYGDNNNDPFDL